ncbi:MAG: 50S ribosomal protein L13 [Metamycoplasmataceae bacterium]
MRQTTILKKEEIQKNWYIIDAENQVLGRVATLAASYLRGKNKSTFTQNIDMGDNIIIVNAEKIILTGNKEKDKIYYSHSLYPGGLKKTNPEELRAKKPVKILEKAIKGMLPHTRLGAKQYRNLYVYAGINHNQEAQKPMKLEVQ